jgi:hypothetical protein
MNIVGYFVIFAIYASGIGGIIAFIIGIKKVASAIKTEDVNLLDNGFKFISVAKGLFAVAVSLFLFGMFANYIRMTGFRNFILLIRGIP